MSRTCTCTSTAYVLHKFTWLAHGHEESFAHGTKPDSFLFSVAVGRDYDVVFTVAIAEDYQCSRCRLSGCLLCVLHIGKHLSLGNKRAVAVSLLTKEPRRVTRRKATAWSLCHWAIKKSPFCGPNSAALTGIFSLISAANIEKFPICKRFLQKNAKNFLKQQDYSPCASIKFCRVWMPWVADSSSSTTLLISQW